MKVTYTTANGRVKLECDGIDRKTAFEFLAKMQDMFEEDECGICHTPNIKFVVREYDGNMYYKMLCQDPQCGAQLDFGQYRDKSQGLFPKRYDKENNRPLPNRGWYVYQKQQTQGTQGQGQSSYAPPATEYSSPQTNSNEIPF